MANVVKQKQTNQRKKNLSNLLLLVFLVCSFMAAGQKKSDQLQAEQSKLEKKLSTTKNLLEKVKSGTQNSINELKLIDNQVKFREELVQNFDNQIRGADLTISSKDSEVKALESKLERLKAQYKKLLIYAYKHRNRYGKMMYIFSASNYFEAVKRNSYLKRISEIQEKQFRIIKQNQGAIKTEITTIRSEKTKKERLLSEKIVEKEKILKDKDEKQFRIIKQNQGAIKTEITTIRSEKTKKERLLSEKIVEKEKILKDKEQKQKALDNLRKDEKKLMAELKKAEKQKDELKRRIKQAIEKELADAEAKAKKEAKKAEAAGSKKTETNSGGSSSGATTAKKEVALTETKESIAMGKNFESNRGKLPWPVAKGTVTEGYGKNPHPTMANVYTNNNGIDIGAPKNAQVRYRFRCCWCI